MKLPPRSPLIYITTALVSIIALAILDKADATPFQDYPYNSAPRLVATCEANFIGNPYSEALRPKCDRLWGMFARDIIITQFNTYGK